MDEMNFLFPLHSLNDVDLFCSLELYKSFGDVILRHSGQPIAAFLTDFLATLSGGAIKTLFVFVFCDGSLVRRTSDYNPARGVTRVGLISSERRHESKSGVKKVHLQNKTLKKKNNKNRNGTAPSNTHTHKKTHCLRNKEKREIRFKVERR